MNDQAFMQELEQFKQQIEQEVKQNVEAIVTAMLDQITDTNPLDTGRCTASWTVSTGEPEYNEATGITNANRATRSQAKELSMATILTGLQNYQLGDPIFISNGTNYVSRLENEPGYVKTKDGHAHFVAKTQADFAHLTNSSVI